MRFSTSRYSERDRTRFLSTLLKPAFRSSLRYVQGRSVQRVGNRRKDIGRGSFNFSPTNSSSLSQQGLEFKHSMHGFSGTLPCHHRASIKTPTASCHTKNNFHLSETALPDKNPKAVRPWSNRLSGRYRRGGPRGHHRAGHVEMRRRQASKSVRSRRVRCRIAFEERLPTISARF